MKLRLSMKCYNTGQGEGGFTDLQQHSKRYRFRGESDIIILGDSLDVVGCEQAVQCPLVTPGDYNSMGSQYNDCDDVTGQSASKGWVGPSLIAFNGITWSGCTECSPCTKPGHVRPRL